MTTVCMHYVQNMCTYVLIVPKEIIIPLTGHDSFWKLVSTIFSQYECLTPTPIKRVQLSSDALQCRFFRGSNWWLQLGKKTLVFSTKLNWNGYFGGSLRCLFSAWDVYWSVCPPVPQIWRFRQKKHKLELVNITLVKGFWLPATLNPMRPLMMMKSASFQVINVMFIASRISCPDSREIRQEWLLIFLWKAKVGTFLQKKVWKFAHNQLLVLWVLFKVKFLYCSWVGFHLFLWICQVDFIYKITFVFWSWKLLPKVEINT